MYVYVYTQEEMHNNFNTQWSYLSYKDNKVSLAEKSMCEHSSNS